MPSPAAGARVAAAYAARTAVSAVLLVALSSALRAGWMPPWLAIALVAFVIVAAWRPAVAMIGTAVMAPIATYTGRAWNGGIEWPELLVLTLCTGYCVRGFFAREPHRDPLLARAAGAFALIIATALFVELWVLQMRISTPELLRLLWTHLSIEYFHAGSPLPAVHASALLLEGVALLWIAATVCRADPRYVRWIAAAVIAGGTLAAGINIYRLAQSAARGDAFVATFVETLAVQRYNAHHGDPNAAGSHFGMLTVAAIAFLVGAARYRLAWLAAVIVLSTGLWLTGSRAAYLSVSVALAIFIAWRAAGSARQRTTPRYLIAAAAVAAGLLIVIAVPMRGTQQSSAIAVSVRTEMAKAALRMAGDYPLFGIGPGGFFQHSADYTSPELYVRFPTWPRNENAHNNYLQILAELGVAGLALMLTLAAIALARARAADRIAILAALAAFLISCLAGHPLLVRDPAYAFWILLGAAAAPPRDSLSAPTRPVYPWRAIVSAAVVVLVIASIPFRVRSHAAAADFEHVGIGVSAWQTSADGVRFRWMDRRASFYVPSDANGFQVKMQPERETVTVELRLNGRLANVIRLPAGTFTEVRLPLPSATPDARFIRLDVHVVETSATRLMVGRVEPLK